jgi:hypothetical protein
LEIVEDIEELRKIVKAFLEFMTWEKKPDINDDADPCLCSKEGCSAHRALFESVYGPIYLDGDEYIVPLEWKMTGPFPWLRPTMNVDEDWETGRISVTFDDPNETLWGVDGQIPVSSEEPDETP